jgi:hypothetical protein
MKKQLFWIWGWNLVDYCMDINGDLIGGVGVYAISIS